MRTRQTDSPHLVKDETTGMILNNDVGYLELIRAKKRQSNAQKSLVDRIEFLERRLAEIERLLK